MKTRITFSVRSIALPLLPVLGLLLSFESTLRAADPLDDWKWINPLPQGNRLSAVTYGGGRVVAVGAYGAIIHSPDLATLPWTVSRPPVNGDLNAVAFGNGTYVAAGTGTDTSGMILTSTDATNWFKQSWTNANTRSINGLAYGAGVFVAVGERGGIWSSEDGTNWIQQRLDAGKSDHLNGIVYQEDFGFVTVGDKGAVLTSTDGLLWETNLPPTTITLNAITYGTNGQGEGIFVTVGKSGLILTSPDAANWTPKNSGLAATLKGITYAPGIGFTALGSASSVSWITASPDGENWTAGLPSIGNEDYRAVTYAPGMFVAVGHYGGTISSETGMPDSWTLQTTYAWTDYNNAGAWSGSNFVVANLGGSVVTSPDGVEWTYRFTGFPNNLRCIACGSDAYGGTLFVAGGDNGTILTSNDEGENWAIQDSGIGTTLNGLAYVNDIFMAVGASGVILTSPDGVGWSPQTSFTTDTLRGAAYGAGLYVVAGDKGTIRTSPDGVDWAPQAFPDTRDLNGVIYAFGNFIAFGERYRIFTSPDGTNWTARLSGGSSDPAFSAMAFGAGRVVAAGGSATILSSADGINWTSHVTVNAISQRFIVYGANRFVAGGSGGAMVQALATVSSTTIIPTYENNTLTLTWSGGGTLESAPDVSGPYTEVPGAASPYLISNPTAPRQFFRVLLP